MNVKRLRHLIEVLKKVPPQKFDIGVFVKEKSLSTPADCVVPKNFIEIDCRTTCCALGWAAMDKDFRSEGLDFIGSDLLLEDVDLSDYDLANDKNDEIHGCVSPCQHSTYGTITYNKKVNFHAIEDFFDLQPEMAKRFFLETYYNINPTTDDVIDRIDFELNRYEGNENENM